MVDIFLRWCGVSKDNQHQNLEQFLTSNFELTWVVDHMDLMVEICIGMKKAQFLIVEGNPAK